MSNNDNNSSLAWLGLLKWSLSYTDGTSSSTTPPTPMSEEDKKFLESVMKDGIIDENERMKTILKELTSSLESKRKRLMNIPEEEEEEETKSQELSEEEVLERMEELRDIIEQIDYARAFASMGGVTFLIGLASERGGTLVDISVRMAGLAVLSTMSQNNPPVQMEILKRGVLKHLCDLYFQETVEAKQSIMDDDVRRVITKFRSRIVQTLSCAVRSNVESEKEFCEKMSLGPKLIENALSGEDNDADTTALQKRSLFFLRALVTSDSTSEDRIRIFEHCIQHVIVTFLEQQHDNDDVERKEMLLNLINDLLTRGVYVEVLINISDFIASRGVTRVDELRRLLEEDKKGDEFDREVWKAELGLWEEVLMGLAKLRLAKDHGKGKGPV